MKTNSGAVTLSRVNYSGYVARVDVLCVVQFVKDLENWSGSGKL